MAEPSHLDTPRPKQDKDKDKDTTDSKATTTSTESATDTATTTDSPTSASSSSTSSTPLVPTPSSPPSHPLPPPPGPSTSDPGSDSDDYGSDDSDDDGDGDGEAGERDGDLDSSDEESSGVAVAPSAGSSSSSYQPPLPPDYSKEPLATLAQLIQHDQHTSECYQEFNPSDEPWIRQQLVTAYEANIATSRYVQLQSDASGANILVVPRAYGRLVACDVMNGMLQQGINGRVTAKDVHRHKAGGRDGDDIDVNEMVSFHELVQTDPEVSAVYARLDPSPMQHHKLLNAFLTYAHRQPPSHYITDADGSNLRLLKSLAKACLLHVCERLRQQAVRALQIQVYALEHAPPPPSAANTDIPSLQQHLSSCEAEFEEAYVTASTALHRLTQPITAPDTQHTDNHENINNNEQQQQQQQQTEAQVKSTFEATS